MRGTKSVDLGKDRIGVLIAKLAVPAVVAQVINLLYNLVDRMYVSAIPGEEGTLAIAGLGVVFPITLIVSAFANLVGLGGAAAAHPQKEGDPARAESSGGERAGWLCRRGNKVKRAEKPPQGGFPLFLSASCEKCRVCAVRA